MASGTPPARPATVVRGVVKFINIRGVYANSTFKHMNFRLELPDGTRWENQWSSEVGTDYVDIIRDDEIEVQMEQDREGKWHINAITNLRNGVKYAPPPAPSGCLVAGLEAYLILAAVLRAFRR
jgi:hypothetical protein